MPGIRAAGFNERRCIARDTLCLYGSIVTTGTYSSDSALLSKDDIFRALKQCLARHPVLSTTIQNSDSEQPYLERARSIDLTRHVHLLNPTQAESDSLQPFLEQIHNEPLFDYETRPQWRVFVLPLLPKDYPGPAHRHRIAFASSHALADGISGLVFHKTFLTALRSLDSLDFDENPTVLLEEADHEILPPLEHTANLTISWSFLMGPLLSEYLPPWFARLIGLNSGEQDSSTTDRTWFGSTERPAQSTPARLLRTAVEITCIPPKTVQNVLQECKRHNARVTGLLNHFIARALARALHSRSKRYTQFVVDTAMDLRRCISQGKDQMANFASVSVETAAIQPAQLDSPQLPTTQDWEAVQRTTQRLSEASSTLADQPVALLRYLTNFRPWTLKNASTAAKGSFGMSNLGVFDGLAEVGAKQPSWVVEEMIFSQSADATSAPFNVNVASAKNGSLYIVLSWWPGMLGVHDERQFMKEICADVVTQVNLVVS